MTEGVHKILKLIESADPGDAEKLDEIDARVNLFAEYIPSVRKSCSANMDSWIATRLKKRNFPLYTRSRDALKAIRPEGWEPWISSRGDTWKVVLCKSSVPNKYVRSVLLKTEELAELHAVIQAIEYERNES